MGIFEDFSTDDYNSNDEFAYAGIWGQTALCQNQMVFKGSAVSAFSLPAQRRSRAPQTPCHFDRAVEHLLLEPLAHAWLSSGRHKPYCRAVARCRAAGVIVFLGDDAITRQLHVAHFRGCATLFHQNTFEPDLRVKSSGHSKLSLPRPASDALPQTGNRS